MPKISKPLTRAGIVQHLRDRISLSSKDAGQILESVIDTLVSNIVEMKPITIKGFGRFEVKHSPSRPARNPKTGAVVNIEEHYRPTFNMSRAFREKLCKAHIESLSLESTKEQEKKENGESFENDLD
jgi:nucleoid DNA-binding protein